MSAVSVALALFGNATAQTGVTNPQRPAKTVDAVRSLKIVQQDAAKLDGLLERGLRRTQEVPQPIVDDATFVRRAYLNIIGRIPNLEETEKFLADQAEDKRATLCDTLLSSPGRTSHFTNFWFDLLRVKSRQRQLSGEPFAHFIREQIQQDVPYDEFVSKMIVADGAAHGKGNGATGMLLRDMNMPHDSMSNTLRLFLGTRLECAQCHNHPFDHWTQKQFFEMAAFFGGIKYRDSKVLSKFRGMRQELANVDQRVRQRAVQLVRRMAQGIEGTGSGVEKLPKDYQYDDARPNAAIKASTILGAKAKLKYPKGRNKTRNRARGRNRNNAPEINSREALADWMTDAKNPLFAKVIANRMWERTFGRGLVEPIDDWKKENKPVHPELMKALERLMVKVDFDLRQFERVLVHTKLFQRQVAAQDPLPGVAPSFAGPVLRRMTAEQVWDSLLTLVFDDIDERLRPMDDRATLVYAQFESIKNADKDEILEIAKGGRNMMREAIRERQKKTQQDKAMEQKKRRQARPLLRELARARREGDQTKVAEIARKLEAMGAPMGRRAGKGNEGDLLRASDLSQPARPGHLLRQFGQADRETIDNSSDAATVPQVLTLMNGFLDQRVLNGASALRSNLQIAPDGERRVRIAYLTMLNREPSEDELLTWRKLIALNGPQAINDLVWVLCNCNEFRFVR